MVLLVAVAGLGITGCKLRVKLRHCPNGVLSWVFKFKVTYCGLGTLATKWRVGLLPGIGGTNTFTPAIDQDGTDVPVVTDAAATTFLNDNDPFSTEFPEIPTDESWEAWESSAAIDVLDWRDYDLNMTVDMAAGDLPATFTTNAVLSSETDFSEVYLIRFDCDESVGVCHEGTNDGDSCVDDNGCNGGTCVMQCDETILRDDISITIPAVSEWGVVVMVLLTLSAGAIVFRRIRRKAVPA